MEKKLALQILQDLHDKELFSVRTALEELIPELKDSGDEKTLKEIEDFILYKAGYLLDEETEHRFIKFLEKQKEQKEPFSCGNENGDSEKPNNQWSEDERMVNAIEHILYENYSDAAIIEGVEIAEIVTWLENQKEQKTDGKAMLHVAEKSYQIGLRDGKMELKPAGNSPLSREEILYQLLQNGSITMFDYLYLIDRRKPAEWSEEDEKMIECCIRAIEFYESHHYDLVPPKFDIGGWLCSTKNVKDWLKSLRPQPHWKPSEEQMDSLHNAIVRCKGYYDTIYLPELYEDLKKL